MIMADRCWSRGHPTTQCPRRDVKHLYSTVLGTKLWIKVGALPAVSGIRGAFWPSAAATVEPFSAATSRSPPQGGRTSCGGSRYCRRDAADGGSVSWLGDRARCPPNR